MINFIKKNLLILILILGPVILYCYKYNSCITGGLNIVYNNVFAGVDDIVVTYKSVTRPQNIEQVPVQRQRPLY